MKHGPSGRVEPPSWRRQFNESFCSPDGSLSWTKTMANIGQATAVVHFARQFDALMDKPEALAIVLTFIVAPDVLKKLLAMKYQGTIK